MTIGLRPSAMASLILWLTSFGVAAAQTTAPKIETTVLVYAQYGYQFNSDSVTGGTSTPSTLPGPIST